MTPSEYNAEIDRKLREILIRHGVQLYEPLIMDLHLLVIDMCGQVVKDLENSIKEGR